jgi:hypothetical protein
MSLAHRIELPLLLSSELDPQATKQQPAASIYK